MMEKYNRPLFFYGWSLVIPWLFWAVAAYISRLPETSREMTVLQGMLGVVGLIAPVGVAAWLFLKNKALWNDLKQRTVHTRGASPWYTVIAVSLIVISMVLAQLISVLFGYSIHQFHISGHPSFSSALFSPWFILVFAPVAEELAWHSYGTDALRQRFTLFNASLIFAAYWVLWHLPLSFIKGYYHSNMVAEGWIYSLNFVLSLFVLVILMNWIYYKTNRNLLIVIVFHLSANISNELFATHPISKVIQTGLLLVVTLAVLLYDRQLFFGKGYAAINYSNSTASS